MPIYEYECNGCSYIFENIEVCTDHRAKECPNCGSENITRLISLPLISTNPESIKHSLPDPVPPLRELIGKNKPGTEGGFKELENDHRELKEYTRHKDKHGNNVFLPKERKYFDGGSKK